jgi:hypothetical protein
MLFIKPLLEAFLYFLVMNDSIGLDIIQAPVNCGQEPYPEAPVSFSWPFICMSYSNHTDNRGLKQEDCVEGKI